MVHVRLPRGCGGFPCAKPANLGITFERTLGTRLSLFHSELSGLPTSNVAEAGHALVPSIVMAGAFGICTSPE